MTSLCDELLRPVSPMSGWHVTAVRQKQFPDDRDGFRWCRFEHWAAVGKFRQDRGQRERVCQECRKEKMR